MIWVLVGVLAVSLIVQTMRLEKLHVMMLPANQSNVVHGFILPAVDDERWIFHHGESNVYAERERYQLAGAKIEVERKLSYEGWPLPVYKISIDGQELTGWGPRCYFRHVKRSFIQRKALEGMSS